jgi:hypothetical protein
MKYAVEMGPGAMICMPKSIKIASGIRKLRGSYTDTQILSISRRPTFENRLKMYNYIILPGLENRD